MTNRIQQINEYGFYYYVPMAEAYTIQIPVTISCSYDKCLYCDLNQRKKFRELSLDEIESNIQKLRYIHEGKSAKRFLLAGGNPFVLSPEKLLKIAGIIKSNFPELFKNCAIFMKGKLTQQRDFYLQAGILLCLVLKNC